MDTRLKIITVDPNAVEQARQTAADDRELSIEQVEAGGGEPLRCCLTDASPGESLLLFGYRPQLPNLSPYVETGAVFVHARECDGPASTTDYPLRWVGRPQVYRAYDERGWIHPATTVHDGTDSEAVLRSVLETEGVVEVHSRNIGYGCFMFAARRDQD